ncbi:hypothetical protein BP6252_10477 [Coleophoma cylindrospora]|uniref:ABM domain-containing protein n=1 Tax=Coleophoma cylindrospora TaxID=1849047 RepID=A0A3D8QSM0_9HELO|nr:hypothetical protein BP6252_10477 [Coleophoma cylindrospora]
MTVTEFAILPLRTTQTTPLPSSLLAKFKTAKEVLEKASGFTFYFLQQVEDPSTVYILGSWPSVAAHHVFLPSPENQVLLELLEDTVTASEIQLWHLEADILKTSEGKQPILDAPTISCNRHFVPSEKRAGFSEKMAEVKPLLEGYTRPYDVQGGWRIEKEVVQGNERDEWVLFSGFEDVDHHMAFAKTDEFAKYREIVEFVEGFEVKHLKRLRL